VVFIFLFLYNFCLSKMEVLYRVPYPRFFSQHKAVGGHVAHSIGVIGGFVEKGHEVTVMAHEGREPYEKAGAEFEEVPGRGRGPLRRQLWLRRFFCRSKQLLSQQAFDLTYTRYSASAAPWLWWALAREEISSILEINSLGSQRLSVLGPLDAQVIQACSVPIVVSETLKRWIGQVLGSGVASKLKVVQNGVGEARFRPVAEERSEETFRCAFAGLIKPHYGLKDLIDAARLLPESDFSFHIFGAGPFMSELESYARDVGNAILEGEIPFGEVPDRLRQMDCLVYTTSSDRIYQSPTKLFEYMAIGRPIVAARTPQTEEILLGGKLGRLFELEDSDALAKTVREVQSSYDAALKRARKAQCVAQRQHSWKARVQDIIKALPDS